MKETFVSVDFNGYYSDIWLKGIEKNNKKRKKRKLTNDLKMELEFK
jgi:hypothetical protein